MLGFPWKRSKAISKGSPKNEASQQSDLDQIAQHAAQIESHELDLGELNERIADLEDRLEFLQEEAGQENKYRTELSAYISDLREEAAFNRRAKKIFGSLAIIAAAFLLITPVILAYSTDEVFVGLPDTPKSALLAAMIAGGITLILTITRSVYRSARERLIDDLVPPQVRAIHELTRSE